MYVERVEVVGYRGVSLGPVDLGRVESLCGPWAVLRALRDGSAGYLRELAALHGREPASRTVTPGSR